MKTSLQCSIRVIRVPEGTSHWARHFLLQLATCTVAAERCCESVASRQEGAGLGLPSNRVCVSGCCTHSSEQQEGCRLQELPLGARVTEQSWQWPGLIFRSGICISVVESSCMHHPQVTPLVITPRKPPDCFSRPSSEQLSSHVLGSSMGYFYLFACCVHPREAPKKPLVVSVQRLLKGVL